MLANAEEGSAVAELGRIVVLNGPPRSGKSSIADAIQGRVDGVWMNLGVDLYMRATPPQFQPGIGLRPEGVTRPPRPMGRFPKRC